MFRRDLRCAHPRYKRDSMWSGAYAPITGNEAAILEVHSSI